MEDEQTDASLCLQLAVQDLWVSDNSIFFGLLQHCVRVGRSIWIAQSSLIHKESWLPQLWSWLGGLGHHRPQASNTAPGEPFSPVECLPSWFGPFH